MPASPIRRHRRAASLAGVVLGLGLLAGCAGQRAPGDYSSKVKTDFIAGCKQTANDDKASFDATAYCTCAYDALSGTDGVSFDEFKKVNDAQVEKPAPLPSSFTKIFTSCASDPAGGSTTTSAPG